jgi:acetyltransferase EpsM
MGKIRLYGAGGHSQVVREILELQGDEVARTFDDNLSGVHWSYAEEVIDEGIRQNLNNVNSEDPFVVTIGNNKQRKEIVEMLGCKYHKAIHPTAIIGKNVKIGEGSVIIAGVIVNTNTKIGKHVILNTYASIDHDNTIGDYVHISPRAALCGHVTVGEGTHVGTGALVIPNIKIGKWCTIGAGTVIIKDVPDFATVVGNPGRILKIAEN